MKNGMWWLWERWSCCLPWLRRRDRHRGWSSTETKRGRRGCSNSGAPGDRKAAVIAQFVFELAPLRSRNHCWDTGPWGAGTGWDGGNQLNPTGTCNAISPNSPKASLLHPLLPCSAALGWGDKSDQHPAWANHPMQCSRSPSAPPGGQECSVVCSSWSTMLARQLNFNHYRIPNPAGFAAPAQHPLSSREIEMGIFSTWRAEREGEHPPPRH